MDTNAARTLALELMSVHLDGSWSFHWSNARTEFGRCNYTTRRIVLSKPLTRLNGIDQVRDTILHEIAHAIAGHSNGHNANWQAVCRNVGANPTRCYDAVAVNRPEPRWIGTCPEPDCTTRVTRQKLVRKRVSTLVCKTHRHPITFHQNPNR